MAKIVMTGGKHCVAHSRTGAVLKRKGKRVCFGTRAAATAEAGKTRCRVTGKCPIKR